MTFLEWLDEWNNLDEGYKFTLAAALSFELTEKDKIILTSQVENAMKRVYTAYKELDNGQTTQLD